MVCAEVLLQKIPNDYKIKKEYLDNEADSVEVLYLGSSHILYGINPVFSKYKTYNAAYVSQSLFYDKEILYKYRNNWKNLKCIVIPIDYFSLFYKLEEGIESWRAKNYAIYWGLSAQINIANNFEITANKVPINILRLKDYYRKHISNIGVTNLGFGSGHNLKVTQDLEATGVTAAKRHFMMNNPFLDENLQYLRDIIAFGNKKKIPVVFLTCPAYMSYQLNIDEVQLTKTINEVNKIVLESKNVFYFNLFADESFNAEDFFDADHFNDKGAEKLTKKMDSIINSKLHQ